MSADAAPLLEALARFTPGSPVEADDLELVRDLARDADPWDRGTAVHVTGSALVVDPDGRRVLLRWHPRQRSWLQVGGHADPGERDPVAITRREAEEETGLTDLRPWPGPEAELLHAVVVQVPANDREAAHRHADLRFVFATDRPGSVVAESDDAPLRWLSLPEAAALTTEDNVRESLRRLERLWPVTATPES